MITKTEFKTGLKHCPVALFHPSLIPKFITSGRRGVLKGIVNISIKQGLKYALPININCLNHSSMKTLMGKIGGYSQEYLYWLVRIQKPKVVVETGVYRGISSAFILAALHDNGEGKLYSIDLPNARYVGDSGIEDFSPLFAKETTGFAVPESLKDRWKLILGDSKHELPKLLRELAVVDFFYHDSEHTYNAMMWEYQTVFPYLSDNAILSSDDINWNTAFKDFCDTKGLVPNLLMNKFGYTVIS